MVAGGGGSVVVVVVVVVVVLDMEMVVWYRDTVRSEGAPKLRRRRNSSQHRLFPTNVTF